MDDTEIKAVLEGLLERAASRPPGRPYVALKAGASLDGRIATAQGASRWITGPRARRLGHALRGVAGAVLVGSATVAADDPALTTRLGENPAGLATRHPMRVALDSRLAIGPAARMLAGDGARRLVITGSQAPEQKAQALRALGVELLRAPTPTPQADWFLPRLAELGVELLLVEGGGRVHGHFIAQGLADELFLMVSGLIVGQAAAPGWCAGLAPEGLETAPRARLSPPRLVGEDILLHGRF